MNYGLYLSASGALTSLYKQDVYANNLANMDTVGFKADIPVQRARLPESQEDALSYLPSDRMMEKLGGGVGLSANRVRYAQGSLEYTKDPMNVAVEGDGFFVVRDSSDTTGEQIRLTRDGRLALNAKGRLVMATTGMAVLDEQNRPIDLTSSAALEINTDGTILQQGQAVGKLKLVDVPDRSKLGRLGDSLFVASAESIAGAGRAKGLVRQGALEHSTVDEVKAILDVTAAGRDFESNIGLMQAHDRMTDRAINVLGRVG
jgi:flagellar basal body rod protein FlgG